MSGRALDEFDLHHLYDREKSNLGHFKSLIAGKRKSDSRSQRPIPSIFSQLSPSSRDDLLWLFESRCEPITSSNSVY
jgi:hypothetical protein